MAMSLFVFVTIFVAKMSPKELWFFVLPRPEGRGTGVWLFTAIKHRRN
jgi:hypothetical protein